MARNDAKYRRPAGISKKDFRRIAKQVLGLDATSMSPDGDGWSSRELAKMIAEKGLQAQTDEACNADVSTETSANSELDKTTRAAMPTRRKTKNSEEKDSTAMDEIPDEFCIDLD